MVGMALTSVVNVARAAKTNERILEERTTTKIASDESRDDDAERRLTDRVGEVRDYRRQYCDELGQVSSFTSSMG